MESQSLKDTEPIHFLQFLNGCGYSHGFVGVEKRGNGLKKILEFSFLRSKLALNFESDVLVNAFERATLERVADFACLEEGKPSPRCVHLFGCE